MKNLLCIYILLFSIIFSEEDIKKERSYYGNWPTNNKDVSSFPDINIDCPGETGCPCNLNNDCFNDNCIRMPRGKYCTPKIGEQFPNFIASDQYGDEVSIYDFADQGKYIIIEIGASWCAPCHEIANWLTFGSRQVFSRRWFKQEYYKIRDLIQNDQIFYIKVLFEDSKDTNVTFDTLYDWFQKYPDEKVPILADTHRFLHTWIKPTGLPTTILLNDKLEIVVYSNRGINNAFDKIIELYND